MCKVYEQCKLALRIDPFAGPVNMTLYYESLCPDCKRFFATQLYQTWQVLGTRVLNLTLVPYGNARVSRLCYEEVITLPVLKNQTDLHIMASPHSVIICLGFSVSFNALHQILAVNQIPLMRDE